MLIWPLFRFQARNPSNFSVFWGMDDFINSFWLNLTFTSMIMFHQNIIQRIVFCVNFINLKNPKSVWNYKETLKSINPRWLVLVHNSVPVHYLICKCQNLHECNYLLSKIGLWNLSRSNEKIGYQMIGNWPRGQ